MPIDHLALRSAVEAFAARREQATYFEVLRNLMGGEVLFDITGSDFTVGPDGRSISGGSMRIAQGAGPDGALALLVFTRQEEASKRHAAGVEVRTLGQPAASVLAYAKSIGCAWVYVDPVGPTCAIKVDEAEFVLRNTNNVAVKNAIPAGRGPVVQALASGGSLFYAIEENPDGSMRVHTAQGPGGQPARLAFTSPAEIVVSAPGAAWTAIDIARIVNDALTPPFDGLIINPAGPWVGLFSDELEYIRDCLSGRGDGAPQLV